MKIILIEIFKRLNACCVPYAVLRGYENLPDHVSHDIDFCVDKKDVERALDIVSEVMVSNAYRAVQYSARQGFSQVYYYGKDGCLKLDFWTEFKFRGLFYLPAGDLLHNTKEHNGIVVLDDSAELTVSFLKEFLHNGIMRKDKIAHLSTKAKNYGFLKVGSCKADIFEAEIYREKLLRQDLNFALLSKKFVIGLLRYNIANIGLFQTMWSIFDYALKFLSDKARSRKFFVVLVGPDGSGKTTISQLLLNDVRTKKSSFTDAKYIHGRWGFLPNLGRLKGDVRQVVSNLAFDTVNNQVVRAHTKKRISVYMTYYFIDYLIGSVTLVLGQGKNRLTIADRYFYDYFIAEHFENYPKIFELLYFRLLPTPDLVVYLEADSRGHLEEKARIDRSKNSKATKSYQSPIQAGAKLGQAG